MINQVAEMIAQYDAQGVHRTATEVDALSGRWLADELRARGVSALLEPFETDRVDIQAAMLDIGGTMISGVPAFDCGYTGSQGITGTIGPLGSTADIGVVRALPFDAAPGQQQVLAARRSAGHRAIVVVTDASMPAGGIALVNAEHFEEPFGPPVLQVAGDSWPAISDAMTDGCVARVIVQAVRSRQQAFNVGGEIWGRQPRVAPLVIMTPRSGWWHCASERGGGIACLLLIAQHFTENPPARNVIFTANTGHELGHTGLSHFLARNEALVQNAHAWIHLGANFAARNGSIRMQYGSAAIETLGRELVREKAISVTGETAPGTRPLGEARNIHDGGGTYLSILGGNPLFHHPADRFPDAVDIDTAARCASLLVAAADRLANEQPNQGTGT